MKYYFTYGTDEDFPYRGGWTEIEADNMTDAVAAFRIYHKDLNGCVACAFMYTEDKFKTTSMTNGNLGAKCHERITLTREIATATGEFERVGRCYL